MVLALQCLKSQLLFLCVCVRLAHFFLFLCVSFVARDVIIPAVKLYIVAIFSEVKLFTRAEAAVVLFILESQCCYTMICGLSQFTAIF